MTYPHEDPRDIFGQDLIKVFGPKAERKHVKDLTYREREEIIKNVPKYIDTYDIGARPSIFQVTNKILTVLQQSGALMGVDLDWCDDLRKGALVRHDSAYVDVSICYKNNDVQRGIWLQHLVQDILFSFNPTNVLSGLARKLSDGTVNLNNGQHRTIACVIVGVRQVPIEYIASDSISIDIDEYATDNLNTLSSSEFDEIRIRVWRNKVRKAEGRTDLDDEDIKVEELWDIHAAKQSRFVEVGTANPKPLECTSAGNMRKYFKHYGNDLYTRALDINCTVWSKTAISSANCWGLMEFLVTQRDLRGLTGSTVDFAVQQAIQHRYSNPGRGKKQSSNPGRGKKQSSNPGRGKKQSSNPGRGKKKHSVGMHSEFKSIIKENPVALELRIPEEKIVAAGIYKICKVVRPDVNWAPIMFNGMNIADDFMGEYRIMPCATNTRVSHDLVQLTSAMEA